MSDHPTRSVWRAPFNVSLAEDGSEGDGWSDDSDDNAWEAGMTGAIAEGDEDEDEGNEGGGKITLNKQQITEFRRMFTLFDADGVQLCA